MLLREYTPSDWALMAELFFQTEDYSQEQLDAWVTEAVDMQAWDASFRRTRRLLR